MHRYPRILAEAPVGRHFCQIHDDATDLSQALIAYTHIGLLGGSAVVVAAEPSRLDVLRRSLKEVGVNITAALRNEQLTLFDAHELLASVMVDGAPDAAAFRRVIGGVLSRAAAAGHRHTRVYGELVNVLWRDGEHAAAIQLEGFWNDLAFEHRFSLFCGYEIPGLEESTYETPLPDIAHCHSDVLETDADERLQTAVDRASTEILGLPMSSALCYFGHAQHEAEHRLPAARRTILWLRRNMPAAVGKVLARARVHYSPA